MRTIQQYATLTQVVSSAAATKSEIEGEGLECGKSYRFHVRAV
ncbi:MAG: hypothetical protein BWX80_01464 [Candidatus Hydrogenedentes bacterium ADurb.Bin101]|jgi:hypothetical protein|nr:MAG: hypothetical protein BWX80_01464 [Candidatus Hydrogenedentes bacterium ADurb.Bin101]